MKLSTPGWKSVALAAGLSLAAFTRLLAQAKGSLSELDIEHSELKVTLEKVHEEKKKLSEAIVRLSEAVSLFAKAPNAESRLALEAQMRHANDAMGAASPNAVEAMPVDATITDGMAISVKDDLALVVINVGTKQ